MPSSQGPGPLFPGEYPASRFRNLVLFAWKNKPTETYWKIFIYTYVTYTHIYTHTNPYTSPNPIYPPNVCKSCSRWPVSACFLTPTNWCRRTSVMWGPRRTKRDMFWTCWMSLMSLQTWWLFFGFYSSTWILDNVAWIADVTVNFPSIRQCRHSWKQQHSVDTAPSTAAICRMLHLQLVNIMQLAGAAKRPSPIFTLLHPSEPILTHLTVIHLNPACGAGSTSVQCPFGKQRALGKTSS